MDPKATLILWRERIAEGDFDGAKYFMQQFNAWCRAGGFCDAEMNLEAILLETQTPSFFSREFKIVGG